MLKMNWDRWLNSLLLTSTARKPRRVRLAQVEGLENRALLTANLPVAVNDIYTANENHTLTGSTVLANDTDADGDAITQAVLQNTVSHGTLTLNTDGTFTYVPATGYTGVDSFTYFAKDAANNEISSAPATVLIGVQADTGPVVGAVNLSTNQNTLVSGTLTGVDAQGDTLTFAQGATPATNGTVVVNSDGTFTFTPTTGFTGVATFSYQANDGTLSSSDGTVSITVNAVPNTAPVVSPLTISTIENSPIFGTLPAADAQGDTLTFSAGSTAATHGTVVINSNGTFTFTPANDYTGLATFSYKANDGNLNSADATVTVNVVGLPNTAPVVSPISLSTNFNTAVSGTLTGADAEGDHLTFSQGATAATNGTVVIQPDGSFTFTPTTGFTGAATFSYKANDGSLNSNDGTVTINVGSSTNIAPVANPQTVSTAAGTAVSGTLTGSDANGDHLTFSVGSTAATHGTVVINPDGTFTFTPATGYTGAATFTFKVSDGTLSSPDATVMVNVGSTLNTAPTVTNGNGTTTLNTPLSGSLASLATDAQGDSLSFAVVNQPNNGTVTVNPDGTFTFNPAPGFTGTTSFTFSATDGSLTSKPGTFTISVNNSTGNQLGLNLAQSVTVSNNPSSPTPLDPNAALTGVTSGVNLANSQLTVSFVSGQDSKKDRLVITSGGGVSVQGNAIFVNGTQVGTITSGKQKDVTLRINFNSNATEQSIDSVLRRIAIQTNPSTRGGVRVVKFQLSAGSSTATDTIAATVAGSSHHGPHDRHRSHR